MSDEIGPQLPKHLLSKFKIVNREDESEIDSQIGGDSTELRPRSSDHGSETSKTTIVGPMLPQEKVQIGPQIPSSLIEHKTKTEDHDQSSCQQPFPANSSSHKNRSIGPAIMPPSDYQECEEENIIGPVLPKDFKKDDDNALQKTIQEFEERAERMRKTLEPNNQGDKHLQRGEWMLVPPETKFLGETPTNMRSRQFKKRAQDLNDNDNSLWTETPAEREERLKKQASSNQKRKHVKDEDDDEPTKYSRVDLEIAEKVEEYNKLYRPKSLLETHSEDYVKSRKWKEDDASKRPFDREKDVLGTRRMDSRKRKEFLDNAKSLSSKFGHSKHGSFL